MMDPIAKKLMVAGLLTAAGLWAQARPKPTQPQPLPAPRQKFDVVSVRRCNPNGLPGPEFG